MRRVGGQGEGGFTLLEVMIAVAVFFVAVFAMLELTSRNLRYVRELQRPQIDIGALAAEYSMTNNVEEGVDSDGFGDLYPGATWRREVYEVATNGLFQVDFTVLYGRGRDARESRLSILMYRRNAGAMGAPLGTPMGQPMGNR
jgi:prepilin-type N-terminal cleavage/methylation domain-containing protein